MGDGGHDEGTWSGGPWLRSNAHLSHPMVLEGDSRAEPSGGRESGTSDFVEDRWARPKSWKDPQERVHGMMESTLPELGRLAHSSPGFVHGDRARSSASPWAGRPQIPKPECAWSSGRERAIPQCPALGEDPGDGLQASLGAMRRLRQRRTGWAARWLAFGRTCSLDPSRACTASMHREHAPRACTASIAKWSPQATSRALAVHCDHVRPLTRQRSRLRGSATAKCRHHTSWPDSRCILVMDPAVQARAWGHPQGETRRTAAAHGAVAVHRWGHPQPGREQCRTLAEVDRCEGWSRDR